MSITFLVSLVLFPIGVWFYLDSFFWALFCAMGLAKPVGLLVMALILALTPVPFKTDSSSTTPEKRPP